MDMQPESLPRELAEARRARVAQALGPTDVMVLCAAPQRLRSRDTEYPYRPDSELYWLREAGEPVENNLPRLDTP